MNPDNSSEPAATVLLLRDIADHLNCGETMRDGDWGETPLDLSGLTAKQRRAFQAGQRAARTEAAFALRCIAYMNERGVKMSHRRPPVGTEETR